MLIQLIGFHSYLWHSHAHSQWNKCWQFHWTVIWLYINYHSAFHMSLEIFEVNCGNGALLYTICTYQAQMMRTTGLTLIKQPYDAKTVCADLVFAWCRWHKLVSLPWRHNDHDGVSNHQPHGCLLNRFFQTQMKENIKAPRHWPLWGDFNGDRWIPRTKGQLRGKCFHLMTSSCEMVMSAPIRLAYSYIEIWYYLLHMALAGPVCWKV